MFANYKFSVQERKKIKVIIETDAACEADDQYEKVHKLLSLRFIVKGIISEQFFKVEDESSVDKSFAEEWRFCFY